MATRYQRCNHNPYIKEEQTTQWSKDTKGVIRIHSVVCSSLIYDSDYTFDIFKLFLPSTYKVPPICQSSALYIIHRISE
jgi:hypothetical protein